MNKNLGYPFSWNGFIDYTSCYYQLSTFSIILGIAIAVGTAISIIPQIVRIVKLRSSLGINPLFVFCTNISQALVICNIFILYTADFVGLYQPGIPLSKQFPRFLTFLSNFALYYVFNPVCSLITIFFHLNTVKTSRVPWIISIVVTLLASWLIPTIIYSIFCLIALQYGFNVSSLQFFAKSLSVISACVNILQYAPQFITACKLKDNGSFSLLTLAIQAPGGSLNVIYMSLIGHEDWSLWLPMMVSVVQQWLLLGLFLYYKIQKKRQGHDSDLQSTLSDYLNDDIK